MFILPIELNITTGYNYNCRLYLILPVTVVHNGKIGVIMESIKKTYTVFPDMVCSKLVPECILSSFSISDVVNKILSDFTDVNSDTLYVNLDYCNYNLFVYHLYLTLSHFLLLSFGGFYQIIFDTVQVKEGD